MVIVWCFSFFKLLFVHTRTDTLAYNIPYNARYMLNKFIYHVAFLLRVRFIKIHINWLIWRDICETWTNIKQHTYTVFASICWIYVVLCVCVFVCCCFQIQFADSFDPFAFENYNFYRLWVICVSILIIIRERLFSQEKRRKKRPVEWLAHQCFGMIITLNRHQHTVHLSTYLCVCLFVYWFSLIK